MTMKKKIGRAYEALLLWCAYYIMRLPRVENDRTDSED